MIKMKINTNQLDIEYYKHTEVKHLIAYTFKKNFSLHINLTFF